MLHTVCMYAVLRQGPIACGHPEVVEQHMAAPRWLRWRSHEALHMQTSQSHRSGLEISQLPVFAA